MVADVFSASLLHLGAAARIVVRGAFVARNVIPPIIRPKSPEIKNRSQSCHPAASGQQKVAEMLWRGKMLSRHLLEFGGFFWSKARRGTRFVSRPAWPR